MTIETLQKANKIRLTVVEMERLIERFNKPQKLMFLSDSALGDAYENKVDITFLKESIIELTRVHIVNLNKELSDL